jgi:ribosomal protein S18 acetylase RimI-like enzyme
MIIEKMALGDVPAALRMGTGSDFEVAEGDCFWSNEQLERWIKADEDVLLVAKEDNKVIAFALTTLHKPTGKATLENFFIHANFRGKQVALLLMEEIIAELKRKGLTYICFLVQDYKPDVIEYFRRKGFKKGHHFVWFGKHL